MHRIPYNSKASLVSDQSVHLHNLFGFFAGSRKAPNAHTLKEIISQTD